MRAIVLWLLRFLEANLDTDLKARLEAYRAERAKTESQIADEVAGLAQETAALEELRGQRSEVGGQIERTTAELSALKEQVIQIDAEPSKAANAADGDVLRSRL